MTDVDPFTPGPSFDELQQQQLGDRLIIVAPHDFYDTANNLIVPAGSPLTIAQAQALGLSLVVGMGGR